LTQESIQRDLKSPHIDITRNVKRLFPSGLIKQTGPENMFAGAAIVAIGRKSV